MASLEYCLFLRTSKCDRPDAGLAEYVGTSSLEFGQPGQATTTIRILRDLVHNANANGLTWEQFDWIRAKKGGKGS